MSDPSTELRTRDVPKRRRAETSDQPLRAELFSVSQLQRHARTIASWHEVSRAAPRGGDWLLERLADNETVLAESYRFIAESLRGGRQLTPAAEWFLDNYHLIEEQIRTARKHLPRSYDRELPRLANAATHGTPRVYHLALELISHAHGRVDVEPAGVLSLLPEIPAAAVGELWAIPFICGSRDREPAPRRDARDAGGANAIAPRTGSARCSRSRPLIPSRSCWSSPR